MGYKVTLFDGTDDPSDSSSSDVAWMGGHGVCKCTADTWAGTLVLESITDSGSWIEVGTNTVSENGEFTFDASMGRLRATVVGSLTNAGCTVERVRR